MTYKFALIGAAVSFVIAIVSTIIAWFNYLTWLSIYASIPTIFLTQYAEYQTLSYLLPVVVAIVAMMVGISLLAIGSSST